MGPHGSSSSRSDAGALATAGLLLAAVTAAVLLHGYHFGVQDQFVYLPAVLHHLDPALFPHDAGAFLRQTQFSIFDELVAGSIRLTGLPEDWNVFLWHLLSLGLLFFGAWRIVRRCFADAVARWGALAALAAALTLVAGGTLLFIADPYLHPRTPATALLLLAVGDALDRRPRAAVWVAAALVIHPTLGLAGVWHLAILCWPRRVGARAALPAVAVLALPAEQAWLEVLDTRWFLFPGRWPWYAWLGVVLPLALLAWLGRRAGPEGRPQLRRLASRMTLSGAAGAILATAITATPGLERLVPAEPMRVIHLPFLLAVLLGGGWLAGSVLRTRPLRWALVFVPLCAGVFSGQRWMYPSSPHIEFPGGAPANDWVAAFVWVRENTPRDALFALGPRHLERPGEDFHSFRALARRSSLADEIKDRGVAASWPELAEQWREQVEDQSGWTGFSKPQFRRLREEHGVSWVVLEQPGARGLDCPYRNPRVLVCRVE